MDWEKPKGSVQSVAVSVDYIFNVQDDLLKTPREATPWQALNSSKNDRAFITTMGFDVATFDLIRYIISLFPASRGQGQGWR
ncbi:hypothetical protein F5887DRAFT_984706 [Amanita rubescens]|nr:hypothetical protein F5887DRAFT_1016008 [Amanita rubescens]KAF8337294.1 hypothetical protein F5887DRAFT_984706 [Amanita rubescens]